MIYLGLYKLQVFDFLRMEHALSHLTLREREAVCRCYDEFLKDSSHGSASIERVALDFQVDL
jgi:predicted SAM-dependent methyltransferase